MSKYIYIYSCHSLCLLLLLSTVTILGVELDENPIGSEWARYIYVLQPDLDLWSMWHLRNLGNERNKTY